MPKFTFNFPHLVLVFIFLVACSSEKEGDLQPDCSVSDLNVEIQSTEDASCDTPGSLTASASGGASGYQYSVDGTNFNQDGLFDELPAGNYTVTVEDEDGCTATVAATVGSDSGGITLTVTDRTDAGCGDSNGTVSLSADGGAGDYTYSLDDGDFQSSSEFSGLGAGSHTFTAMDGNGCTTSTTAELINGTSLTGDVMPVISSNCAVSSSCHAEGAAGRPVLETASQIIASAARIQTRTSAGTMPPAGQPDLSQNEIDLIACWVEDGAMDN